MGELKNFFWIAFSFDFMGSCSTFVYNILILVVVVEVKISFEHVFMGAYSLNMI